MKKISIILLTTLAYVFVSCVEDSSVEDSSLQSLVLSTEDIVVSQLDNAPNFNLEELKNEGVNAMVLNVVYSKNFSMVGDLRFVMQLSKNEDFATVQEVATSLVDNQVCVDPFDWQTAHLKLYGKNPKAQDAYVRFAAYVENGTSSVRIGNPNFYYGTHKVSVTPFNAAVNIDDSYSLVINGNKTIRMNHMGDIYDNPIFYIKVDVTTPQKWAIKGAKLTYAPIADEGSEVTGRLIVGEGWGTMPIGTWLLSVNMETLTYEFASAVENLWTPGDANAWNHGGSQMLFTSDYTTYVGFANLSPSGFKFTTAADWNHINYGDAGDGKLSTDGGAGNLTVAEKGLYWCKVDIAALTWSATKIETIGVIGGFNGWSESLPLTSEDGLFWTGTVTFNEGDEYKFRCNNDWAINLGGADEYNLVPDGANLKAPAAGTFTIILDLSVVPYACYLEQF